MTSEERVIRAIEFTCPNRLPLEWFTYGIGEIDLDKSDIAWVFYKPEKKSFKLNKNGAYIRRDEWGCLWEKTISQDNLGQVVGHPLEDWNNIRHYSFPEVNIKRRFGNLDREIKEIKEHGDKYIIGYMGHLLWERMHFLRGLDTLMIDLYMNEDRVHWFLKRIVNFHVSMLEEYAKHNVNGVTFCDDWGIQNSLMINPIKWRQVFKPYYRQLFDIAHQNSMHVIMHSCGYIYEIIPDLIEIGVDVLQLDQPELLGVDKLGRDFGGKVCFDCPIDIQKFSHTNDLHQLENVARRMLKYLAGFQGGFIARAYPQPVHIGMSKRVHEESYRIFRKYGRYPLEI